MLAGVCVFAFRGAQISIRATSSLRRRLTFEKVVAVAAHEQVGGHLVVLEQTGPISRKRPGLRVAVEARLEQVLCVGCGGGKSAR